jgi:hypothetical protein
LGIQSNNLALKDAHFEILGMFDKNLGKYNRGYTLTVLYNDEMVCFVGGKHMDFLKNPKSKSFQAQDILLDIFRYKTSQRHIKLS